MATEVPLLVAGILSDYFRESVVVAILAGVVLLRVRRYKSVAAGGAAAAGSAATVVTGVVVSLLLIVALGYWDPPVSEIVGDALGAGRALWSFAGEWLVEQTLGRLDSLAGA
ncbi:hypothetical protein [Halorubrum salinum]|uniref:hypothetical protein n=1 Tax=Halorubrum salinum TaxID=767517 RepID=UPI002113284D|nr:hypothetical protein [Halorubrum salinum]